MTNIERLISHIVNNIFPLNEYSDGEMKKLMQHFKDEAEDFNIEIDDDRLEAYIKRFDQIKNGLPQADIRKYSLSTLIKMISKDPKVKEKGDEEEKSEVIEHPGDVVYESEDGSILLYYGMNLKDGEPGCVRLKKREERWCVTKSGNSMWKSYRSRENLGHPSFYLAYNVNLPQSDPLSAVALQARESNRYAYTDRTNSPGMSNAMSFDQLVRTIPWLSQIPDLQSKLRWVPLSKAEKAEYSGGGSLINLSDWKNLSFTQKLRYFENNRERFITADPEGSYSSSQIFRDAYVSAVLEKVLPKYPEVLKHLIDLSANPEGAVFSAQTLLHGYENYPEAQKKSLLRLIGADSNKVPIRLAFKDTLPFELKQDITKDRAWEEKDRDVHIFSVPNKDILVAVERRNRSVDLTFITPEEIFSNKPLNEKTVKYLLQDPNITDLPFPIMANAIKDGHIKGKDVKSLVGKYLNAPKTTVVSRKVDDKLIIFDEKSLIAFELDGDKVNTLDNPQEFLDKVASTDEQKKSLQTNFFKGLTSGEDWKRRDLPSTVDKDSFVTLINSMPYEKRTVEDGDIMFAVANPDRREPYIFLYNPNSPDTNCYPRRSWGRGGGREWFDSNSGNDPNTSFRAVGWEELFKYWREAGTGITDRQLASIMRDGEGYDAATESKYLFAQLNPPMAADAELKPVMVGDLLVLANRTNPANSYTVSRSRGKLTQKPLSAGKIRTILGEPAAAAPQAEPAQGEQPAAQAAEAPAVQQAVAQGDRANVGADLAAAGMNINALPNSVRNRVLRGAVRLATTDERGARSRNQLLGNRGRVTAIYKLDGTASAVYMITLAGGTQIASIAMQPGNYQGILAGGRYYNMASANDLAATLQARNINEDMNKENIKKIIREIVKQKIAENQPAPSKPKENPGPAVAPGKPGEKPGPRRPFIKPDTKPEPKAAFNKMNENEKAIVQKIAARFKSKR